MISQPPWFRRGMFRECLMARHEALSLLAYHPLSGRSVQIQRQAKRTRREIVIFRAGRQALIKIAGFLANSELIWIEILRYFVKISVGLHGHLKSYHILDIYMTQPECLVGGHTGSTLYRFIMLDLYIHIHMYTEYSIHINYTHVIESNSDQDQI